MSKATRRRFLKTSALGILATVPLFALLNRLGFLRNGRATASGNFRIRPVSPERCAPSFVRYCHRARFGSAAAAIRVSSSTRYAFTIYQANAS